MSRLLFALACVVSLLLWADTLVVWAASCAGLVDTQIFSRWGAYDVHYWAGGLTVDYLSVPDWSGPLPAPDHAWAIPGCSYTHFSYGNGVEWTFALRYWLPLVGFGALPALWIAHFVYVRGRHLRRRGFALDRAAPNPHCASRT